MLDNIIRVFVEGKERVEIVEYMEEEKYIKVLVIIMDN